MSASLKNTLTVAALGLLVAGLSGCGTENPMSPSLVVAPTVATTVAAMPIEQDPTPPGAVIATIIPFEDRAVSPTDQKKPKKDNPGRHRGWNSTP